MFCPSCGAEFRAGVMFCENCQVNLVQEPPREDMFASPEKMAAKLADAEIEPVLVGQYPSVIEAQKQLSHFRIASVIASEQSTEPSGVMHARFFLMVAQSELDAARQAFEKNWREGLEREGLTLTRNQTVSDETHCPACSTQVAAGMTECPECGLFLGAEN